MANPALHWLVTHIDQTVTATGYKIVIHTNNPAHLWLRWTRTVPQKHFLPVIRRGATVGTIIDQCFVAHTDVEQEEAGDTIIHTFYVTPWPHCEWRWFYFWGTVGGHASPSLSPIYEKHRTAPEYGPPQTLTFIPDKHPETNTTDGWTWRQAAEPFLTLRNRSGNRAEHADTALDVGLVSWRVLDEYSQIVRAIMLFDTHAIPSASQIDAATLRMRAFDKNQTGFLNATIGVCRSYPASNTEIIEADYQALDEVLLSDTHRLADIPTNDYILFTLNFAGRQRIISGGITKLGLRECTWDLPAIIPTWEDHKYSKIRFRSADYTTILAYRPLLTVTFRPPL